MMAEIHLNPDTKPKLGMIRLYITDNDITEEAQYMPFESWLDVHFQLVLAQFKCQALGPLECIQALPGMTSYEAVVEHTGDSS